MTPGRLTFCTQVVADRHVYWLAEPVPEERAALTRDLLAFLRGDSGCPSRAQLMSRLAQLRREANEGSDDDDDATVPPTSG